MLQIRKVNLGMILEGKSVSGGIAIGKLAVYRKEEKPIASYRVEDIAAEVARFADAMEDAKKQLVNLYEEALREVSKESAMIFDAQRTMLEDAEYVGAIVDLIESQKMNAECAVVVTGNHFAQIFETLDDEYMRERGADVKDVGNRVIAILQGEQDYVMKWDEPVILLAEDLTPGETVRLDKSKVLAIVTRYGSSNSHTAILARTMNIPAMVGVEFPEDVNGKLGVMDAYTGRLIVDPSEEELAELRAKTEEEREKMRRLQELKGKETVTMDGKKIELFANIGSVADVESALSNDAEGIGLFRTEFLYLESEDYPDEEVQFGAYKTVAEKMPGKKIIIRTLDIGADKQVDYLGIDKEENPAMGYRAIRICLDRPEIFKTQLRAIYRASVYGDISIMFPMIISVEEVRQIKEIIVEVKRELSEEGVAYKDCEIGIMIETPAAVMISDLLAEEVDFFSVGTNDLTQYTLAIDRQNPKLDYICDSHHEAVLRMLQMVVANGHKGGCKVGICGELAADTDLTETFLKMGFDELSVSPSMILKVREAVRNIAIDVLL